jgi:hypothetical protein
VYASCGFVVYHEKFLSQWFYWDLQYRSRLITHIFYSFGLNVTDRAEIKLHNKSDRRDHTRVTIIQEKGYGIGAVLPDGLSISGQEGGLVCRSPECILGERRIDCFIPVRDIEEEVQRGLAIIPFFINPYITGMEGIEPLTVEPVIVQIPERKSGN